MQNIKAISKNRLIPAPVKCLVILVLVIGAGILFAQNTFNFSTPVTVETNSTTVEDREIIMHMYNYNPDSLTGYPSGTTIHNQVTLQPLSNTKAGTSFFLIDFTKDRWYGVLEIDGSSSVAYVVKIGVAQTVICHGGSWIVTIG